MQINLSKQTEVRVAAAAVAVVVTILAVRALHDGNSSQVVTTVSSAEKQVTVTQPAKTKPSPPVKKPATKPKAKQYKLAWKHDGPGSVKVLVLGKTPRNLAKPSQLKAGTRVQLTAVAGNGWFYTWGGSCHGSNLVCKLSMNNQKSVNAIFKPNPVRPVSPSRVVVVQPAPTPTVQPDNPPASVQPPAPDNPPAAKKTKPGTRKLIPPPLPPPPPTSTEGE